MTKHHDDEAFARLRAADPAAGVEPDHESLRRAVTERAGAVDELAARRRRPTRMLQVAAASAGALAVGMGGFALGGGFAGSVGAGSDAASDAAALPAITLDGGPDEATEAAPEMGIGSPERNGMGAPQRMSANAQASSDRMMYPGFGSRIVFTPAGLGTSGTSATAYGYDAASRYDADTLHELAAALGVQGKVRAEHDTLVVGRWEKNEPTVSLYADGAATFSYNDPTKDVYLCAEDGECTERDLGKAPQGDAAVEQAREFLVTLGVDPANFELEASDVKDYGSDYSFVTAFQVVDGQRTGDSWGVSFTGAGIQSAHGQLADLVDLGEYEVVSPVEAVERLGDPRFGNNGSHIPPGWAGPAGMLERGVPEGVAVPAAPTPGGSFDWPVESVTITSERLGLAQHRLGDGAVALVPTYVLTADDGRSWSVIAVAEKHLNF